MSSLTCITCQVRFHDGDLHRAHFKGDWHRYNLKRKVANLPVVTADTFEERKAAHEGEGGGQKSEGGNYCVACGKCFKNNKAYENHIQSKKHQEMILKFENTPPAIPPAEEEEEEEDDDDMEVEEVDSDEWEDDPIEIMDCLFCSHHSSNLEKNLSHMTVSHSFFLPDPEFISDLEGLMCYLGAKVGQGHMCLWCDDRGKKFSSVADVQRHMLDKGHCKLLHQGHSLLEYEEWYDYSTSYPEQDNPEGEVDLTVLDDTGYELVLPSGTRVGHRSLLRYYKQSLNPNRSVVLAAPRFPSSRHNLMSTYKSLGWTGSSGPDAVVKVAELKFGLYSDNLTVLQSDSPTAVSFTKAAKDLLNLNLDAKSGFSQISCRSCKISLENFSNFLNKVNVGQSNLLEIMKSEGTIEVRKKGRPKKGFEKNSPNTNKESLLIASKRPKKITKKFEEFENSQKAEGETGEPDKTTKVSSIVNSISGVFNCEACNKVFRLQEDLDSHISSSHGQIMYKCDRCASTLRTKEDLKIHQTSTGHEDFIILEIAGVAGGHGGGGKPQRSKLKQRAGCKQCDQEFDSLEQLSCHSREEHGGTTEEVKMFSCEEEDCTRQFSSSNSLAYHRSTAHQSARLQCPETDCEKLFKTKSLLSRHLKTHTSERAYSCDKCDKSFKTRSNLYSHLNVHTESKFFCEECGQQFKHRTSLASHRRWHQGERPFKCPFCTKTFNQKGNLQEHIRIHTGDKPFKCELCPRAFTTSSQHRLHVKRHLGVKQFKCELCSKCFLNKDTYNTHLRRHKGEKPFSCKICKKSFAESWALTKHLRCHTGQQPYLCKECGKRFADSSNLAKHKKTHEDSAGKTKPTVWNIVKNVGQDITNITEAAVTQVEEEGEQVIYITYENEDQARQASDTLTAESAEYVEVGDGDQQIQLTTKEGAHISLAFTSQYFKEIPN